jgi:hypothetical protein
MTATIIWRPEAHVARLRAAAAPAAAEFGRVVAAKAPSKTVAASIFVAPTGDGATVGSRSPLGALFEKGVGPHEIAPKGQVLKLADGRFVTGAIRHPGMRAQPFLRPSLPLWPSLYRRAASGALRGGLGGLVF